MEIGIESTISSAFCIIWIFIYFVSLEFCLDIDRFWVGFLRNIHVTFLKKVIWDFTERDYEILFIEERKPPPRFP
jgi:hypothetical protein